MLWAVNPKWTAITLALVFRSTAASLHRLKLKVIAKLNPSLQTSHLSELGRACLPPLLCAETDIMIDFLYPIRLRLKFIAKLNPSLRTSHPSELGRACLPPLLCAETHIMINFLHPMRNLLDRVVVSSVLLQDLEELTYST